MTVFILKFQQEPLASSNSDNKNRGVLTLECYNVKVSSRKTLSTITLCYLGVTPPHCSSLKPGTSTPEVVKEDWDTAGKTRVCCYTQQTRKPATDESP